MPKLNVEGAGEFEVPAGKRLVLALTEDAGVDQLHACGGWAKCTTCKVEVVEGEPEKMTAAEKQLLEAMQKPPKRICTTGTGCSSTRTECFTDDLKVMMVLMNGSKYCCHRSTDWRHASAFMTQQ